MLHILLGSVLLLPVLSSTAIAQLEGKNQMTNFAITNQIILVFSVCLVLSFFKSSMLILLTVNEVHYYFL